jgi:hypothetical protein
MAPRDDRLDGVSVLPALDSHSGGQAMTLFAIVTRHQDHAHFNLEPRLYATREEATERAREEWDGVEAVSTYIVTLTADSMSREGTR